MGTKDVMLELDCGDESREYKVMEHKSEREVSLFTNVNKESGKVIGAESTPFVLPRRWTFDTLKLCVTDYINRQRKGLNPLVIKQLYYKRASGKKVVEMHSDGDIPALLKQYPMTYPSGKRKRSCTMYLAVDAQEKPSHCTSDSVTPRRSPRLAKHSYAVYLHKFVDGKVGNTAEVITDFDRHDSLDELIQHIATENSSEYIYKPENGIYWLRKGSKQPVSMKTNLDFDVGKKEYGGSNSIRIACTAVEVDKSSTASSGMTSKTRRKLDMRSTSSDNELWNEIHLILVRDLEKKGILWRYGVKHLKLWTDMIANGKLAGAGEEPVWDQHLDQIITPPKSKRSSPAPTSSDNFGQQPRLMEMLLIQNQTLMTMMASNMAAAQNQGLSRKKLIAIGVGVLLVVLAIVIIVVVVVSMEKGPSRSSECGGKRLGRFPLIVISMDGFRDDYLKRGTAPNILKLAKRGVQAKFLQPQFPTKTFPNHYSIITGLFPAHHGIVSNSFYDTVLNESFRIGGSTSLDPKWWHGEPVWQTAMKQGLIAASYFWVGSEVKIDGMLPNFTYRYHKTTPFETRVNTVLSWFDLPPQGSDVDPATDDGKRRPDFITLYFYQPDSAGHKYGPNSAQVNNQTRYVDSMIGLLYEGLKRRSLDDKVNIIMLADHGMAATDCSRVIYLDQLGVSSSDILTLQPWGGAFMSIDPRVGGANESEILSHLQCKSSKLRVFSKEQLPKRFHYSKSSRIGNIIAFATDGYLIGTNSSLAYRCRGGGTHGYNNMDRSMRAIFVAHGPSFKKGLIAEHFLNTELYNLMTGLIGVKPAPNDGTQGSLVHLLDPCADVTVPRPHGDGHAMRQDICRYPKDPDVIRNCKNCVCPYCDLSKLETSSFDEKLNLNENQISESQELHFPWGIPQGGAGRGGCILTQTEYLTGYSTFLHIPLWVGYKLDGDKASQYLPRKNCFRRDVRLSDTEASNCSNYYKSGMDRGHLAPNGDFDYDDYKPTMNTFLLSNMAPQHHSFNVGAWIVLEKYVRKLAVNYSSIYVISGSIFDENADGLRDSDATVSRWIKDQPNTVAIPSHFYKIITRCDVTKTSYYKVPRCKGRLEVISFILPHNKDSRCRLQTSKEYLLDNSATVRDVERLTGINFFSGLPPAEQARLKTTSPVSLWA